MQKKGLVSVGKDINLLLFHGRTESEDEYDGVP